jgi:hypothetical protein
MGAQAWFCWKNYPFGPKYVPKAPEDWRFGTESSGVTWSLKKFPTFSVVAILPPVGVISPFQNIDFHERKKITFVKIYICKNLHL